MPNAKPEAGEIVPGKQHSYWIGSTPETNFPPLQGDLEVDVAVIGGGIAGITTAALLKDAGKTVAVVEMNKISGLVTGHTTAKITSMHGYIYQKILSQFGENGAKIYADANQAAIDKIESLVDQRNIGCDFARTPMYLYTELDKNLHLVKSEVRAAKQAGLPVSYIETTPLPFDIKGAAMFEDQARFHPRRYLIALANEIQGDGSHVFENTQALSVAEGEPPTVITDRGSITAASIVVATHFPFYDTGLFFSRLYPYHTYALGVKISGEVPTGMYYTEDGNIFAIRTQPTKKGPLLVVSGGYHKTGQGGDTIEQYEKLVKHTRDRFDVESVEYFWSTQDYNTADNIPYIGKAPRTKSVYLATGFGGWGMTIGTLAAMILSDLITGRENPWARFFSTSRINLSAAASRFIGQNLNVTKQYINSLLVEPPHRNPSEFKEGEGQKVVFNKKEIAAYRDEEGKLYTLSPICRHLACTVNWNNAERTWDCPCHGSRYRYDGTVFHGPALENLREREAEATEED